MYIIGQISLSDCSLVLFIVATSKPRKIWLQITHAETNLPVGTSTMVTTTPGDLMSTMSHPDIIEINQIGWIGPFRIFINKFNNTTVCSSAHPINFNAAHSSHSEITNWRNEASKFAGKLDTMQLGWNSFTLGDDLIKASGPFQMFRLSITEADCMSSLKAALRSGTKINNVPIQCSVSDLKEQRHFLEVAICISIYVNNQQLMQWNWIWIQLMFLCNMSIIWKVKI